jgi:L-threonylcarbamoyladenylate synthase
MRAEVMSAHTPELFARAVARAVALLRAGEVVGLPTETVYGLAANALDAAAVRRVFEVKGRPAENPVIVHAVGMEMVRRCVGAWPAAAERLGSAYWPGPMTLVLPRSAAIPDVVTAGGETVGVRWPGHPLMQAVIEACGFPLAAPSANPANGLSPTCAEHVVEGLGDRIGLIVDGGASQVGIESTVVDVTSGRVRILRPGMIGESAVLTALGDGEGAWEGEVIGQGEGVEPSGVEGGVLRSPGQMARHYAPRARLVVWRWESGEALSERIGRMGWRRDRVQVMAYHRVPTAAVAGRVCVIPDDAEAYARAMYAEWHRADAMGAEWIVVEAVPEGGDWQGIADRLRRAAAAAD